MQAKIDRGGKIGTQIDKSSQSTEPKASNWQSDIHAILGMTRVARDDAAKLGLKFEAYLLDMAVIALSEQLTKKPATRNASA